MDNFGMFIKLLVVFSFGFHALIVFVKLNCLYLVEYDL